jgi:malto-oligosyltrehalose synthase/4-alpha-glucanotransferase
MSALDRLSELAGIAPQYHDIWGRVHRATDTTRIALLQAMGIITDATQIDSALKRMSEDGWRRVLPGVAVYRDDDCPYHLALSFSAAAATETHEWRLMLENGETRAGHFRPDQLEHIAECDLSDGHYIKVAFDWRDRLPHGYHRYTLRRGSDGETLSISYIIAPSRCYLPPVLAQGERIWGVCAQLYGLRSARNWGIGDYADLNALVEQWARRNADIVGVNPLHALFPHNPEHASPYSPSSRRFLNILYIDVDGMDDLRECVEAAAEVRSAAFQARLAGARAAELVDYASVSALKLRVFERLYTHFREQHLSRDTPRARAFRAFQVERGRELRQHALFEALQEHFHAADPGVWGWQAWPAEYRDPHSAAVHAFDESHRERIELYEYLQWQADQQVARVAQRARELACAVGLYEDLSISVDRSGAEAWAHQDYYAQGAAIGAPPDEINLSGQNWGLPPLMPQPLRAAGYEPFIATLRANMRHAGALRIDHVMGLARLYWIPEGSSGDAGTYVSYPFSDLLAIVALESHRNECLVIGEDLGTVPDEVRAGLSRAGVLSYRVLYFERDSQSDFRPPVAYPVDALVTPTTHDLATLSGFWNGRDLELRQTLQLFPSDEVRTQQFLARAQDRTRLVAALEREQLIAPGTVNPVSLPQLDADLMRAICIYLARTPSRVLATQLEDVLGVEDAANLPGTTDEHPNWRRKLPLELERISDDSRVTLLTEALSRARPRSQRPASRPRVPLKARIPRATYRLQLHAQFTFADATSIVPYLAQLGVSHVYCSPYLRARPGSTHGYDIIDHNALNPEIGTQADFERFVAVLRAHGMSHLLDMVPNHMGVMGGDNEWWLDVLENGRSSLHARYFDIEWQPANTDLRNKVLVPVLGAHYGIVLERGELKLAYDPAHGSFNVHYYGHRLPVDPSLYSTILEKALAGPRSGGDTDNAALSELASLGAAFRHLPPRDETDSERVSERMRDQALHKQRLARLVREAPPAATAIDYALRSYEGKAGDATSYAALHDLLEQQAYRLTYWRVASDEINYRRFFDINDLAALRMEDDAVFEATHRMALTLAVEGKIEGIRIDHPDGLYDPTQYFRRLQERYAQLAGGTASSEDEQGPPRPLYVIAEKIAASHERLPADWAVHGTTGYRYAAVVNGLFVDGAAEREFNRIYHGFVPEAEPYEETLYQSRRLVMQTGLAASLAVLATELLRIARADWYTRDYTLNTLRQALLEVVACFPVYRTYIWGEASEQDQRYVDWAIAQATRRTRAADATIFDFVRRALLGSAPEHAAPELRARLLAFAMRVQQFTAPVAAKGGEDTTFYRYNRLVSLNEVGSDPGTFGLSVSAFHGASADRATVWPHTLLATSTHDNKRSEDVRARIDVLSEMPAAWRLLLRRWARINRSRKHEVDGALVPGANEEYLLYQTLLGSLPSGDMDADALDAYRQRIDRYMNKAVREAKVHSSWININEPYEAALSAFVGNLLGKAQGNVFLEDLRRQARPIAWFGALNSLSMTLLKFSSPGVPDIYQGSELCDLSLVDPDNRRPVDYSKHHRMLEALRPLSASDALAQEVNALARSAEDGRAKLWIAFRALNLRRRHPPLFERGDYVPLPASGSRAQHVVAYARRHGNQGLVAIAGRLWFTLGGAAGTLPLGNAFWSDTTLDVATLGDLHDAVDILTGTRIAAEGAALRLAGLFAHFPGALIHYTV